MAYTNKSHLISAISVPSLCLSVLCEIDESFRLWFWLLLLANTARVVDRSNIINRCVHFGAFYHEINKKSL